MILSERFDRALAFAVRVHGSQMRKGTDIPYLSHLLMVAAIALDYGATEDEAIASLLHDVIEDCGVEHAGAIRDQFGTAVLEIVVGCSDTDEIPKPAPSERRDTSRVSGTSRIGRCCSCPPVTSSRTRVRF